MDTDCRRKSQIACMTPAFDLKKVNKEGSDNVARLTAKGVLVDPTIRSWIIEGYKSTKVSNDAYDCSNVSCSAWLNNTCRTLSA
jgi:hypothetical protein